MLVATTKERSGSVKDPLKEDLIIILIILV